jgi:hypothetical protein
MRPVQRLPHIASNQTVERFVVEQRTLPFPTTLTGDLAKPPQVVAKVVQTVAGDAQMRCTAAFAMAATTRSAIVRFAMPMRPGPAGTLSRA